MHGFLWKKCLASVLRSDGSGIIRRIILRRLKRYFFKKKAPRILGKEQATIKIKRPNAIVNIIYIGGFRSSVLQSQPILLRWYAGGCNIYACDIPNHGLSVVDESERGSIKSFDSCIDIALAMTLATIWSRSRGEMPIVLMGHSFGALIMQGLLIKYPFLQKHIAGIIACGTPLRVDHNVGDHLRRWQKAFTRADTLLKFFAKWRKWSVFVHTPEEFDPDDRDDPFQYKGPLYLHTSLVINEAANFVREHIDEIKTPLLFVHGERDEIAPVQHVQDAVKLLGNRARLLFYPEGNHDILRQITSVHDDVLPWILERVKTRSQ